MGKYIKHDCWLFYCGRTVHGEAISVKSLFIPRDLQGVNPQLPNSGFFPQYFGNMDWEFQRCFVKNWEKIHDCNFTIKINEHKQSLSRIASSIISTLYQ